ncbi:MAG: NAD(P)(+) transhydrogenase (Re/Si-specific) subunit beta [Chitinophagales bacterium]|nr:NAD(P)(+) transhydrogenase (Re/Si-specific) subunit beta [Chitinophagales bacterium]HMV14776.1 NAD(P)(+) transhydrogenase (Re/Si-specific) subunit beta [Chitinophagales bacterium]HMW13348.1 NAD(P)(+) transhydrogenase (Re/Si-specific) subunit beta [Chitinophagales bacterium]HMX61038.1 NAD(P)(+) transhydrogenase (Re/Si-specific) subunit beta [Chitinophagales bacterium]HMY23945.1 NAD(P)(+) transhydrogenase (Re/Si-specific) subunit beta [Chitinophagales bacterium]
MKGILEISYLIGSITFIVGLKMMGNAKTARKGNLIGAFGMTVAILGTIFLYEKEGQTSREFFKIALIFGAIAIGTAIGWITAKKVEMTKMPELVSMFNGMGGACAALIGLTEFPHVAHQIQETGTGYSSMAFIIAGLVIGTISFSGSIIAYLKLAGKMNKPIRLPQYNILNNALLLVVIVFSAYVVLQSTSLPPAIVWALFVVAIVYGILFTIPIGGADMPVVISLLNSFTGLAAAFGGFLYDNKPMLTGGILVGSAGTLLTLAMCKAMNRPLSNVIFGAFGGGSGAAGADAGEKGTVKDVQVSDLAVQLNYASKVVIVPGYGLAVAQAQHVIHELEKILEERGVEVKYAIHPVAGRMPGHMNVLLAESNVEYDKLVEMEDINPQFAQTDVVLVVGANDVVNPAAKVDPSSPIYGMPILEVENAKNIVINKRSMNAGYAGIDNLLFYNPKTSMFFGDAKKALTELVAEIKQL